MDLQSFREAESKVEEMVNKQRQSVVPLSMDPQEFVRYNRN